MYFQHIQFSWHTVPSGCLLLGTASTILSKALPHCCEIMVLPSLSSHVNLYFVCPLSQSVCLLSVCVIYTFFCLSFLGDSVLDGSSTLTLHVTCVQHLTNLFEQYLLSRTHQNSFLALPSHPADTITLLQVQFLFDMLQKTISLKVCD